MKNNRYCVIMAGGLGTRLWPFSTEQEPKQFTDILATGRTLLQHTFDRFSGIIPDGNFYVVTSVKYESLCLEQLPALEKKQILLEPEGKNTASCIAYASHKIKLNDKNANIVVSPADHLVLDIPKFKELILRGLDYVDRNKRILTIGVKPNVPSVNYGYIKINHDNDDYAQSDLKHVESFIEKPDLKTAKEFVENGNYFWNSGIFLWSADTIVSALEEYLPSINNKFLEGLDYFGTQREEEYIKEIYPQLENISVDYGIMENAENISMLIGDFIWSDLGTWKSVSEYFIIDEKGNATAHDNAVFYESENCIVHVGKEKTIVVEGLKNYVICETEKNISIRKIESEDKVKQVIEELKKRNSSEKNMV
ncbi:mannose-1-phosphate guanylyltransferase [Ichthyobacterium seriolicida]|uniref:mannose-1-phosphate guanylyltransferase n=1 Tax=Ichthyobacterium seriolicida TaxID=242600 RepID=A0A1J1DZX9_9FLAO|nr:mannose-1-phosphate guanylyltransferase [Ichthyobacterium seriolicida]BAV95465.1 mannose-1-phosphate guanylyltransferase [Ichthyobacterium seriolicida]